MKWQKECPYCGKIYKSEWFYKLHIEKHESQEVKTTSKVISSRVIYREVVYLGTADKSSVLGLVTGKKYEFFKDKYKMPKPTKVDERDYPGVIALKGKGCVRRDPNALFVSKQDWDLEIAGARSANR